MKRVHLHLKRNLYEDSINLAEEHYRQRLEVIKRNHLEEEFSIYCCSHKNTSKRTLAFSFLRKYKGIR